MTRGQRRLSAMTAATFLIALTAACGGGGGTDTPRTEETGGGAAAQQLSGQINSDGSSTVGPLTTAAYEFFAEQQPQVQVAVGTSGTGGGFEKFCKGETDISTASRKIEDDEIALCKQGGVEYAEVQVANDGIAVVTNKAIELKCLKTGQLSKLWKKGSKVASFKDLDPSFPDTKVSLYGPGTDSGTFDFFTEVINGEKGDTRTDYQPSEDDNVLVQGVSGDEGGLGYFGFSYYEANMDKLNLVSVDAGDGCVEPSAATIQDGSYKPLSRPLFMYVATKSITKPQVKAFLDASLPDQEEIAGNAKIVPMTEEQAADAQAALTKAES